MGKIAFVFSGQGDQFPGMGKNLADKYPSAKSVFDMCAGIRPGTCLLYTSFLFPDGFHLGDFAKTLQTGFLFGSASLSSASYPFDLASQKILTLSFRSGFKFLTGGFGFKKSTVVGCVGKKTGVIELKGFIDYPVKKISVVGNHKQSALVLDVYKRQT